MKMTTLYAALSGAFLLGTAALVPAQTTNTATGDNTSSAAMTSHRTAKANAGARDEYKAEKDKIAADYKEAKAKCKTMSGNAKDVCEKEAKGNEKVAKAELGAKQKGNDPTTDYNVLEAKAKSQYEVAKEKCDDMKGKEKSACKKEAKATEDKALAEAKANRKNVASNASASARAKSESTMPSSTAPGTTGKTYK
jgi:hypothetical protein